MQLAMLVSTTVSQGIADCSLKTFFYVLRCYTIKNDHFFEAIKKLLEGWKLGGVLGFFQMSQLRIQLTLSKKRSPSFA